MVDSTSFAKARLGDKLATFIRSDFWFLDGNIVIIAGTAAFKVHRGQLERHSEVFSGLFSLPQPNEQELLDGCHCVELHDCPSDVFYFLGALYDGLYFNTPRANDFPAVAAVLRLSTKYFVEHLRQRCLRRLDLDWPPTLAGWDRREQEATDGLGRYDPRDYCAHPILVINLALEMGLFSILPAALYDLARYVPSKIMAGTSTPELAFPFAGPADTVPLTTLSHDFLCRTFRGRESAQRYMAIFIQKELQSRAPSADCTNAGDKTSPSRLCHESFYFIMLNILRSIAGISCGRDGDPLFTLIQAVEMLSRTDFSDGRKLCGLRMCNACKVDFAAAATRAREEVWRLLPGWFGLESCGRLDKMCG